MVPSSPQATFSRSSTSCTAATRTPGGCSTPSATCRVPGRPRLEWPWSTRELLAAMRRTIAHDHVQFDLRPYRALTSPETEALDQAARRYGEYLRLKSPLTLP